MKTLYLCFLAVLISVAIPVRAGVIPFNSFDGSESLVNFDVVSPGMYSGAYVSSGVSIQAESYLYIFQNSGWLLGTSGYAFNTYGFYPDAKNDITINFGGAITRFGMNFGNGAGSRLSATVSAYDSFGNTIESLSFTELDNDFVGFDFSSGVNKIVIDRTDGTDYFTFLDDIRFVRSVSVPEPSNVILIMLGLAIVAGFRLRKAGLSQGILT